jgi:hypothetical protein
VTQQVLPAPLERTQAARENPNHYDFSQSPLDENTSLSARLASNTASDHHPQPQLIPRFFEMPLPASHRRAPSGSSLNNLKKQILQADTLKKLSTFHQHPKPRARICASAIYIAFLVYVVYVNFNSAYARQRLERQVRRNA